MYGNNLVRSFVCTKAPVPKLDIEKVEPYTSSTSLPSSISIDTIP